MNSLIILFMIAIMPGSMVTFPDTVIFSEITLYRPMMIWTSDSILYDNTYHDSTYTIIIKHWDLAADTLIVDTIIGLHKPQEFKILIGGGDSISIVK